MTDGASDEATTGTVLLRHLCETGFGRDIPIHAIAFGAADEEQLDELSRDFHRPALSRRRRSAKALRSAKGYN
jgi:hypothetical protein